jgi:hypothetical protein
VVVAVAVIASACVMNGTWTATPLVPTADSLLQDVSCVGDDWCLAVGRSGVQPAAQVWDGDGWAVADPPPPGTGGGIVLDVDCGAPDRCLATTFLFDGGSGSEQLTGWNGSVWTEILPGDVLGAGVTFDCVGGGCIVSHWNDDTTYLWDGVDVDVVASGPGQSAGATTLSCVSTTDCLSVRGTSTGRWNGTAWTHQSRPQVFYREYNALSCATSTSSCVAVGAKGPNANAITATAWTWDGTTWTERPIPLTDASRLADVSCTSSSECVALGEAIAWNPASTFAELAWNGSDWYVAPAPPGTGAAEHRGISCAPLWCMAVGREPAPTSQSIAATYQWTNA